jgi:hypothetical protein
MFGLGKKKTATEDEAPAEVEVYEPAKFGLYGVILGFIALLANIFQDSIRERLDMVTLDVSDIHGDWLAILVSLMGVVTMVLALTAFLKHENKRFAKVGMVLGVLCVANKMSMFIGLGIVAAALAFVFWAHSS